MRFGDKNVPTLYYNGVNLVGNTDELIAQKLGDIHIGERGKIIIFDKTQDTFILGGEGKPSDFAHLKTLKPKMEISYSLNGKDYQSYVD